MGSYTKRVRARTIIAKRLQQEDVRERADNAGILQEDLVAVATAGDQAAAADAEQSEQIASDDARRTGRKIDEADILERGDKLRNRMPAVVWSLTEQGHLEDARWATALSYSRFRLRSIPPPDPALADEPDVKLVKAVEAEDKLTRLAGLANLVKAYRKRPNIVAELTRRGFDDEALRRLEEDAEAAVNAGSYARRKAEATKREHEAVDRQKAVWTAIRPMVREAVQGHPELEALFAEC
jgi:hypothetical protein